MISPSVVFLFTVEKFSGSLKSFWESLGARCGGCVLRPQQVSPNIEHLALLGHSKSESSKSRDFFGKCFSPKIQGRSCFSELTEFVCLHLQILGVGFGVFWGGGAFAYLFGFFLVVVFLVGLFFLRKYYYSVISRKSKGL